jgi:tetratricopeptide (TPR) repeat protein
VTNRTRWLCIAALACAAAAHAQRDQAVNPGRVPPSVTQVQQPSPPPGAVTQVPQQPAPPSVVVSEIPQAAPAEPGSTAAGAELMRRVQATTDVAERSAAIEQAEQIYTRAIAADPSRGAAFNNLAVLAATKGDAAGARQNFERAIATDDGHKGFYALNYSKYLQATDKPAAIEAARIAVAAAPNSALANEQLGSLLWQERPADLLPFASDLAARGNTELATRFALQCLRSQSRPPEERRAWLVLLASRAAREYSISDAARDALSAELAGLESDPEVGQGSRQLRAALANPPSGPGDVGWWRSQSSTTKLQPTSGRAAMRDLLLSAGDFEARRDTQRADLYYRTALELGERGPDPDSFLRLVELYANDPGQGDARERIASLMGRYEFELFTEKGDAYARGDWPLVYRMHTALGMTYAYLDVWTSNSPYQNGIFQLSNAMVAAERASSRGGRNALALPAVAVEQLARGYASLGRADLAAKARVDGAVALRKVGYASDAKPLIDRIGEAGLRTLDAATRAQYETLRNSPL